MTSISVSTGTSSLLQSSLAAAKENVSPGGHEWKQVLQKDHIQVETRHSNESKYNLFRARTIVRLPADSPYGNLSDFMNAYVDYNQRAQWDTNLLTGRVIKENQSVQLKDGADPAMVQVVRYSTAAAAGGLISPRNFTDLSVTQQDSTNQTILCSMIDLDIASKENAELKEALGIAEKLLELTPDEKRMVKGTNMKGGGWQISQRDNNKEDKEFEMVITGFSDIGGWLSSKVVNAASASAFLGILQCFVKHIAGTTHSLE